MEVNKTEGLKTASKHQPHIPQQLAKASKQRLESWTPISSSTWDESPSHIADKVKVHYYMYGCIDDKCCATGNNTGKCISKGSATKVPW